MLDQIQRVSTPITAKAWMYVIFYVFDANWMIWSSWHIQEQECFINTYSVQAPYQSLNMAGYANRYFIVDFCNEVHIDHNVHHCDGRDLMLQELRSVSDDKLTGDTVLSDYPIALYDFVDQFNVPQPTTCCYQNVSKTSENSGNVSVHSYFVMPNTGIIRWTFF